MNIIDYAGLGNMKPATGADISEADIACLAQLAYFDFPGAGLASGRSYGRRLSDFADPNLIRKMTEQIILPEQNRLFGEALLKSKRFGKIRLTDAVQQNSPADRLQFTAFVFRLTPRSYVIAYRGTDLTIYGWEESFMMSYRWPIPSQRLALSFLRRQLSLLPPEAGLILTGHSKGGSLADYAYRSLENLERRRIRGVYNFDGPSRNRQEDRSTDPAAGKALIKYVTRDDLIGILLDDSEKARVVECDGHNGLFQHSLFTWHLGAGGKFVMAPGLSKSALAFRKAFGKWLEALPKAKRRAYVRGIFAFLKDCGIRELTDITGDVPGKAKAIIMTYLSSDRKGKREFAMNFQSLIRSFIACRFAKKES